MYYGITDIISNNALYKEIEEIYLWLIYPWVNSLINPSGVTVFRDDNQTLLYTKISSLFSKDLRNRKLINNDIPDFVYERPIRDLSSKLNLLYINKDNKIGLVDIKLDNLTHNNDVVYFKYNNFIDIYAALVSTPSYIFMVLFLLPTFLYSLYYICNLLSYRTNKITKK